MMSQDSIEQCLEKLKGVSKELAAEMHAVSLSRENAYLVEELLLDISNKVEALAVEASKEYASIKEELR
jgi:hypothetical protein